MELISKDDVIKALQKWNCRDYDSQTINPYEVLRDIPTVEERKEGHWGYTDDMYETFVCSVCGFDMENYVKYNYCPNCGARMKGE